MNLHTKTTTVLMLVIWTAGSGLLASLESLLIGTSQPVHAIIKQVNATSPASNQPKEVAEIKDKVAEVAGNVEIIRNYFLFAWGVGAALLGSYVSVALKSLVGKQAIKYFTVSLCTSLPISPYIAVRFGMGKPEEVFIIFFAVAVGAWLFWEIAFILAARLKDAAIKRGWGGVKDEILGGRVEVTALSPQPPTVTPMSKKPDSKA